MGSVVVAVMNNKRSATPGALGDGWAPRAMVAGVLAAAEHLEVAGQVIDPVAVDMVDDLIGVKVAPQDGFHDEAVELWLREERDW